jgi:hypothetical protein
MSGPQPSERLFHFELETLSRSASRVQQRDKYNTSPDHLSGRNQGKGEYHVERIEMATHSNQGISPALLAMAEPECRTRQTHFSEFARCAIVAAMKRGRH